MSDGTLVFERSKWDGGRFRVEWDDGIGYNRSYWHYDGAYSTKQSAIARADALLREDHVLAVRVVDVGEP